MHSMKEYSSAIQLRSDRWSALREASAALNRNPKVKEEESLKKKITRLLANLAMIEAYWAFPGMAAFDHMRRQFEHGNHEDLAFAVNRVTRALTTGAYRRRHIPLDRDTADQEEDDEAMLPPEARALAKPYFEVLIVDNVNEQQERWLKSNVTRMRRPEDPFIYEAVVVKSVEDALIAIMFNHNIQAIVVRPGLLLKSNIDQDILAKYLARAGGRDEIDAMEPELYGPELCRMVAKVRPELDAYLVTERSVEEIAGLDLGICRRVFYNQEDFMELHLNILRGVQARFKSPFFTALVEYSKQPTGVFHAMPISRGKSITRSHWIQDMGAFYGPNIFLAETSATSGGLDSLLEPHGPIKEAQELAARAFGSKQTFFATNGTSTCNKIVVQALIKPGDIVLVDRDCHKSHHYGMVLAGAQVSYLDSYPLNEYSMYGAVPLREIKHRLLQMKAAGKLDQVRMLLLTNCTFDGLIYNVERVMEECLAIKPDLIFLWDEAWFAFARFSPTWTGHWCAVLGQLRARARRACRRQDDHNALGIQTGFDGASAGRRRRGHAVQRGRAHLHLCGRGRVHGHDAGADPVGLWRGSCNLGGRSNGLHGPARRCSSAAAEPIDRVFRFATRNLVLPCRSWKTTSKTRFVRMKLRPLSDFLPGNWSGCFPPMLVTVQSGTIWDCA